MRRYKMVLKGLFMNLCTGLFLVFVGYQMKELNVVDEFLATIDHRYITLLTFCTGTIDYTAIQSGQLVLHNRELRQLYETLTELRESVHGEQNRKNIETSIQLIEKSIKRKYGEKVCPEVLFLKTINKKPAQYFETETNCTNESKRISRDSSQHQELKSVSELVTFLFDLTNDTCQSIEKRKNVFQQIHALHPGSRVIVGVDISKHKHCSQFKSDHVVLVKGKTNDIWKKMLDHVTTAYLLIGRNIMRFDDNIDMNRLLREISMLRVPLVGGSLKSIHNGHWFLNCHQMDHKRFNLELVSGYHHSYHDCLYCPYFSGPIFAETRFLKARLDVTLHDTDEMFFDLFVRNMKDQIMSAVCPDIMFNSDTTKMISLPDTTWLQIAKRYDIATVTDEFGKHYQISCDELNVGYNPTNKHFFTHPCILREISKMVNLFLSLCRERNMICELTAGQTLGAVKFSGIIPWEYDADIDFHPDNASLIDKSFEKELRDHGIELHRRTHGSDPYFNLRRNYKGHSIKADVWPILSPKTHRRSTTKALVDGAWLEVMVNNT